MSAFFPFTFFPFNFVAFTARPVGSFSLLNGCFLSLVLCTSACRTADTSGSPDATPVADAATPPTSNVDAGLAPPLEVTERELRLTTIDGLSLDATLLTPAGPSGGPGVVLIHQYRQDKNQWGSFGTDLAAKGYRVLAISLRGHGDSDAYGGATLSDILNDPNGAPRDVDAALLYLGTTGDADPARLGIVGTSIGANLATASAIGNKAKTYVAISARKPPSENLGGAPSAGVHSVFFVAAQNDRGGQAADCQSMFDAGADPKEIKIYPDSSAHGIALLREQADLPGRIEAWLAQTL